jgi:hypothetical protein
VQCEITKDFSTAEIQAEPHHPQTWGRYFQTSQVDDARLKKCKPEKENY